MFAHGAAADQTPRSRRAAVPCRSLSRGASGPVTWPEALRDAGAPNPTATCSPLDS